jgi:hypothetical protein
METVTLQEKKHKKVFDPLGLEGFELTEGLNSILVNLLGCCGRICFKESEKENVNHFIIEAYDQLATEAMSVKKNPDSWGYYDTMEELIEKYRPILRAALNFEEKYPDYVPNKVAVATV